MSVVLMSRREIRELQAHDKHDSLNCSLMMISCSNGFHVQQQQQQLVHHA
jgi:hypothetical protein